MKNKILIFVIFLLVLAILILALLPLIFAQETAEETIIRMRREREASPPTTENIIDTIGIETKGLQLATMKLTETPLGDTGARYVYCYLENVDKSIREGFDYSCVLMVGTPGQDIKEFKVKDAFATQVERSIRRGIHIGPFDPLVGSIYNLFKPLKLKAMTLIEPEQQEGKYLAKQVVCRCTATEPLKGATFVHGTKAHTFKWVSEDTSATPTDKIKAELEWIERELAYLRAYKEIANEIGRKDLVKEAEALETELINYKNELNEKGATALAPDSPVLTAQAILITGLSVGSQAQSFSHKNYNEKKEKLENKLPSQATKGSKTPPAMPPPGASALNYKCEEREYEAGKGGYLEECLTTENCEAEGGEPEPNKDECKNFALNKFYTLIDGQWFESKSGTKGSDIQCCYIHKCTDNEGYDWVDDTEDAKKLKCAMKDGNTYDIIKEEKNVTDIDLETNKNKVCCRLVETKREKAESPLLIPGLMGRLGACMPWSGAKWEAGKVIVQRSTTDPKEAEEMIKKLGSENVKRTDFIENSKKVARWSWETYISVSECLFNYAALAYGATVSTWLMVQSGDVAYGTCSPEKPLPGTDNCLACNEDPFRICTKERCAILGTCIAVPTVKADQFVCIPGKCEEVGLPLFNQVNISWFIDGEMNGSAFKDFGGDVINIKLDDYNNNKPLPFNTRAILINLTTNQSAQCRYIVDKKNASFAEMIDFENNYFPTTREGIPGWQHAYVLLPGDLSRNATHKIFIKCKNACGVEPEAAYDQNIITFTLDKKPDQLPPEIVHVDPASNSMIRGDLAFVNVSIWLDELGSCKFSDKSINYTINYNGTDAMIPFGQLSPNPENSSVIDGSCAARARCLDRNESCSRCWLLLNMSRGYDIVNFSSPEFNETKMFSLFIRCADRAGNIMIEDSILDYVLMTAPPYNISIIKPENGNKSYDRRPDIELTSEPRMTECRYRIFQQDRVPREELIAMGGTINCQQLNWSLMWPIDFGLATLHKGKHNETLNATPSGLQHVLCAKCRDSWGIEAWNKSTFYVLVDQFEPIIIRMYHDTTAGDYLVVETNEEAECVYGISDTIKCNYNFSDGNAFMTTDKFLHAAYWQLDNLYYIKCKDKWDNYPGKSPAANQCTVIINPFEIPSL